MSDVGRYASAAIEKTMEEYVVKRFNIRKVAVLGAGVMGAQIAAHLVNANVETLLFELPAKEGDPNGNVNKALDGLKKLEPAPISPAVAYRLYPAGKLRAASGHSCATATSSSRLLPSASTGSPTCTARLRRS